MGSRRDAPDGEAIRIWHTRTLKPHEKSEKRRSWYLVKYVVRCEKSKTEERLWKDLKVKP